MLSILIPVYNYDVRELVSIVHQETATQKIAFEILIADDSSTSKFLKKQNQACESFSGCEIFHFPENKGSTYTRNFLATKAMYDWLLFLDADVLPKKPDFILHFLRSKTNTEVVFGGISYSANLPEKQKLLRWKYGKNREEKLVKKRQSNKYLSIISGALFIKKELFLKTNSHLNNRYGTDVLFTHSLKKQHANIYHISNPVLHLGLEKNSVFLEKSKKAIESLAYFEAENLLPKNYSNLQKTYKKLKNNHLQKFCSRLIGLFITPIEKNLYSKNPSLFLFDLYRLHYFIQIKKKYDA